MRKHQKEADPQGYSDYDDILTTDRKIPYKHTTK